MRKLRKINLDELAQEMPVLSEEEQRAQDGGTFYLTQTGLYLGQKGKGYEVRSVDYDTWVSLSGCRDDSELYPHSGPTYGFSSEAKNAIIQVIAKDAYITGVTISMAYLGEGSYGRAIPSNYQIYVNYDSPSFSTGNYYDLMMTLVHELHHIKSPEDAGGNRSEVEAYEAVTRHYGFSYTSEKYKKHVRDAIDYYKNKK